MLHIVSKGILLDTAKVYLDGDSNEDNDPKTVIYSFKPSFKYAPEAKVLAYYIKTNGDFVVGQVIIRLREDLPNYVRYTCLNVFHDLSC